MRSTINGRPAPFATSSRQHSDIHFSGMHDAAVDATKLVDTNRTVQVHWDDGHTSNYDFTWLRVNCPSFLHESGQRTVFPGDVDPELRPIEISTPGSRVSVSWSDGHVSEYKTNWLRAHDNSPAAVHQRCHRCWPAPLCSWDAIPKVDGKTYMEEEGAAGVYGALRKINRAGACILENVGTEEGTVLDIARRIAPISHDTLYGQSFDVTVQANPRNIAYSSEGLRLHMDLVYFESPPGLQFLHCVQFDDSIKGGESIFLDAFAAADYFRQRHPDMFEVLCRVPATFSKVRPAVPNAHGEARNLAANAPAHMEYQRPHFQVNADGDILAVTWAPMFEGVLMCSAQDVGPYHEAYRKFQQLIEEGQYAKDHTVRTRLEPGQCIVFNNRRLLHGREAMSGNESSARLLQGCYVNIDDTMSRLRSLHADEPPSGDPVKDQLTRAGNGSLELFRY